MPAVPGYIRMVFVACAGVGAFYTAARLSLERDDTDAQIVEAAAPRPAEPVAAATAASAALPAEALPTSPPQAAASAPAAGDRSRTIPRASGELFGNLSWLPPPPPPPPPAPPPPPPPPVVPTAPAMPFGFVGMLEQGGGKPAAFLSRGEALLVVSAGDTIDNGTYRVERLSPNEIVMTYLPLNIQQTLRVGGAK